MCLDQQKCCFQGKIAKRHLVKQKSSYFSWVVSFKWISSGRGGNVKQVLVDQLNGQSGYQKVVDYNHHDLVQPVKIKAYA